MGLQRVRHDWVIEPNWISKLMLLNCDVGQDSWESLGLQIQLVHPKGNKSILNIHWKDWCWNWNTNILATWCEEMTHLKRPWCWERLKVGREGDDRGWDGWMALLTQWTWILVSSRSWWWTGRPGVPQFMGLQRVGHDWVTELNWTAHSSTKNKGYYFQCYYWARKWVIGLV